MQVTQHFTLSELMFSDTAIRHGIDNKPNDKEIANLKRLCQTLLEPIRDMVDKPIHINSAFRNEETNRLVGSKSTSQHVLGCAADIVVDGITTDELVKAVIGSGLPYDQVIREYAKANGTGGWVHVSVPNEIGMKPRKQALIIDFNGTRPYT